MKMKQAMKRIVACTLAITMLMTLTVTTKAQAEVKDNLPKKVRLYTSNQGRDSECTVGLSLADEKKSITNVKSNSKNLVAQYAGYTYHMFAGEVNQNDHLIGLVATRTGEYTVTYDIVKSGTVVSSETMQVYAYPNPAHVSLDGDNGPYYRDKTKAKVKVSLDSGNKIKKLEVGTYKMSSDEGRKRSEVSYKTFKNGDIVKLGNVPQYYEYHNGDRLKDQWYSASCNDSLMAYTLIRITYMDKYSKQEETITMRYYGWAK